MDIRIQPCFMLILYKGKVKFLVHVLLSISVPADVASELTVDVFNQLLSSLFSLHSVSVFERSSAHKSMLY